MKKLTKKTKKLTKMKSKQKIKAMRIRKNKKKRVMTIKKRKVMKAKRRKNKMRKKTQKLKFVPHEQIVLAHFRHAHSSSNIPNLCADCGSAKYRSGTRKAWHGVTHTALSWRPVTHSKLVSVSKQVSKNQNIGFTARARFWNKSLLFGGGGQLI